MARATIDYGIDLGTTNSAIAAFDGGTIRIFRNIEEHEVEPSAVWENEQGRLYVGERAKERLYDDPDNSASEFKRKMGTTDEKVFARSGRRMRPEELSAEVLKQLKGAVRRGTEKDLQAAVITVPAEFHASQIAATNRAAELAGLKRSPLCLEPVAAALAYGFENAEEDAYWLVYDFGGGTFDAAILQARDGMFQVVNHGGDGMLGGTMIDWAIVEELLIPAVVAEHHLKDFSVGNPEWRFAVAKLKIDAEKAKIRVAQEESAEIYIDPLLYIDGKPVIFRYELQRVDVERLAEPLILRSINIAKQVLVEKGLGADSVKKVILVGGPTRMPYLRERLRDKEKGLGIPLEFGIDPLTVVAQGAALFARTQWWDPQEDVEEGEFALELDYKPMGPDPEPLVGGKLVAGPSGCTIEFIDTKSLWRSGKVSLRADGAFVTHIKVVKGKNIFDIDLCDATGCRLKTKPDQLEITGGGPDIGNTPLIHSIGVALADNTVRPFFEKGRTLPLRHRDYFKTIVELHRGQSEVIRIPVVEGNRPRADRNHRIATIEIHALEIPRDLPLGSDVEVTIDIDESRLIRVKAHVPLLDLDFDATLNFDEYRKADPARVREDFESEKARLEKLRSKMTGTHDVALVALLDRIDREDMTHEVERSLTAASGDPDAWQAAQNRLKDLQVALDEAEAAIEWPTLVAESEGVTSWAREVVSEHGGASEAKTLKSREDAVQGAISLRDADVLRKRTEELRLLAIRILDEKGIVPVAVFMQLCDMKTEMLDQTMAEQLVALGQRAMEANDVDQLRAVNRQLAALLPIQFNPDDAGVISDVILRGKG